MKRLLCILLCAVLCLALASCGEKTFTSGEKGDDTKAPGTTAQNGGSNDAPDIGTDPIKVEMKVKNFGTMTLELYPDVAPITVANFVKLANSGFYDGLTFHRIYSGFMIQGGDPDGNGTGGSDTEIKGEFAANGVENNLSHTRGVISMARSQNPNSASSQFFIVHEDSTFLDGSYAAFGKLIDGYDVLDAIAAVEVKQQPFSSEVTCPVDPPVIESVRVID